MTLRKDLAIIADWIAPRSRVLDLGCGEGELLAYLRAEKGVQGYGVEIEEARVVAAIRRGSFSSMPFPPHRRAASAARNSCRWRRCSSSSARRRAKSAATS